MQLLDQQAQSTREIIIDISSGPRGCHLGGSLSVTDILVVALSLYGKEARHKVVLSKGHAAAGLYAAMFALGILEIDPRSFYGLAEHPFTGHPNHRIPGITFPTGSLGHGIPCALGWALAQKLRGSGGIGLAICGDGELQEGLCWEAFQIAQAKAISNFMIVVDQNGAQNDGHVDHISPLGDLAGRFRAFGFEVATCNGHDIPTLFEALKRAEGSRDRPLAIVAKTIKGKGVLAIEGNPDCHYVKTNAAQALRWKRSLVNGG